MKIELTRFKVKKGKTKRVDEWMKMLRNNLPAVLKTLDDEKMYVESIFREFTDGVEYLYWYSIQGIDGKSLLESKHKIDKKHLQFSKECLDIKSPNGRVDMKLEVSMIPENIKRLMP